MSLNFDYIYLRQYLELWKVIICKTTRLDIFLWEHKYFSSKLHKMEELAWNLFNFHFTFFGGRPVLNWETISYWHVFDTSTIAHQWISDTVNIIWGNIYAQPCWFLKFSLYAWCIFPDEFKTFNIRKLNRLNERWVEPNVNFVIKLGSRHGKTV